MVGKKTGPNPTDRGKKGTKRSLLTDGNGIPMALSVEGANRHDKRMVEPTLLEFIVDRPEVDEEHLQHICLDKGYDYDDIRYLLVLWGYNVRIKARGVEAEEKREIPNYRARRWVVERTHSWINRFRRLLIRWEKKVENYIGMLHFACAWISFKAAGLFG